MRVLLPVAVCLGVLALSTAAQEPVAPSHPDLALGKPVSAEELAAWRGTISTNVPSRWKMEKLSNGGWTVVLPDGSAFMPVGVEYEPLALYGQMDWTRIARDLDLMRDGGFNTLTVWCMDFNASGGSARHMTIEEMVTLVELARARGLFIQFYLNIDRFTYLFPRAVLPDGQQHGFDIDYSHPDYRQFVRNYARRLAMAFYPHDNVPMIVVWEEKIGLDADFQPDRVIVRSLFGSTWGRQEFAGFLEKRHGGLANLNARWGTKHESFQDAVDSVLLDFQRGVPDNDHRQYDLLEFGEVLLIHFTREFVDAYKALDPSMLFQCRNWDLFGPVRAVHPDLSFLDSFGVNNYSEGLRGYDLSFRNEVVKTRLAAGLTKTAPYVSNFGFRTNAWDGGTHGLVPNESVRASLAADSLALFSFIPEIAGTSYFTYFYKGSEGQWGLIRDLDRTEPLPIYAAFKAAHALFAGSNAGIARADYAGKPRVFVFHGLDAEYDLRQEAWIEHTTMAWDLLDMNVNYEVLTDTDSFEPHRHPLVLAHFHAYDKRLDADVARRLLEYCRNGGTLVIGNGFAAFDRYAWPSDEVAGAIRESTGLEVSGVKHGHVRVLFPRRRLGIPDLAVADTWYVEAGTNKLDRKTEVLLNMEVDGRLQPGLVRRKLGRGTLYYWLFNPCYQMRWGDNTLERNRTSLPLLHYLLTLAGVKHDVNFGNKGFDLEDGRVNVREEFLHHFPSKDVAGFGTNRDEYGEDAERYSGGVFTDHYVTFRGRQFKERGWQVQSSQPTSFAACLCSNELAFFTTDPVRLEVLKGAWSVSETTEPFRVYRLPRP
ncbi:MAG: hypothetical protein JXB04_00685 [Kiritimatiellae bacterium]|nr:hypothetical protein [Kiritimatiellia bacterium]